MLDKTKHEHHPKLAIAACDQRTIPAGGEDEQMEILKSNLLLPSHYLDEPIRRTH